MSILVIANSFSNGLMDVLINDLISRVAGHIQITGKSKSVFRDRQMIENILEKNIKTS